MTTHTSYHVTRPEAEAALLRFENSYGGFPYQGEASIQENVSLIVDGAEVSGFAVRGRHYGSN